MIYNKNLLSVGTDLIDREAVYKLYNLERVNKQKGTWIIDKNNLLWLFRESLDSVEGWNNEFLNNDDILISYNSDLTKHKNVVNEILGYTYRHVYTQLPSRKYRFGGIYELDKSGDLSQYRWKRVNSL